MCACVGVCIEIRNNLDYGENETEFFLPALFSEQSVLLWRDTCVTETPRYKKSPNKHNRVMEEIRCDIFTLVLANTRRRMLALYKQRSTIHDKH